MYENIPMQILNTDVHGSCLEIDTRVILMLLGARFHEALSLECIRRVLLNSSYPKGYEEQAVMSIGSLHPTAIRLRFIAVG